MKTRTNTIKISIYMFLSIVAFFLVMKLTNLEQYTELRFLNALFVIYFSSRLAHVNLIENNNINYLVNLGSVFVANSLNVLLCCLSFFFYLKVIDPGFIKIVESSMLWGHHLTAFRIAFGVFIEGHAASIIISFGVMQYWKSYKSVFTKVDLSNYP